MAPTPREIQCINGTSLGEQVKNAFRALEKQRNDLLAALEAILASGIEHDAFKYKLVQISHADWEAAQEAVERAKGES